MAGRLPIFVFWIVPVHRYPEGPHRQRGRSHSQGKHCKGSPGRGALHRGACKGSATRRALQGEPCKTSPARGALHGELCKGSSRRGILEGEDCKGSPGRGALQGLPIDSYSDKQILFRPRIQASIPESRRLDRTSRPGNNHHDLTCTPILTPL
jgi:hypothetical protein